MEPNHYNYGTTEYIERHLEEANELALKLAAVYGANFYSFLYRPDFDIFIRHEVLPLLARSAKHNINFLDNNHWSQKHPFNFPGPFYTGMSDTCGTGDFEAPNNILYDCDTQEYIFKQPSNYLELICIIDACAVEVLDSYSSNGNDFWSYKKCMEWWNSRFELIEQLNDPEVERKNGRDRVMLYRDYLQSSAATDLRKYCYFLENGRYPNNEELLPSL